jgi:hypothetical protein
MDLVDDPVVEVNAGTGPNESGNKAEEGEIEQTDWLHTFNPPQGNQSFEEKIFSWEEWKSVVIDDGFLESIGKRYGYSCLLAVFVSAASITTSVFPSPFR